MNRTFALATAALALVLTSGCKQIQMTNGEIPAAFVDQARAVTGTYIGHIEMNDASGVSQNMRAATLTISIVGKTPVLTVSNDFINDGCGSSVGPLLNVQVSKLKLTQAAFAFDGGSCKSADLGDRMMIKVKMNEKGKYVLSTWVMMGPTTIETESGTEPASMMSMGTFVQQ